MTEQLKEALKEEVAPRFKDDKEYYAPVVFEEAIEWYLMNLWHDANKQICRTEEEILYHSLYDNNWHILKGNMLNWNIVDKWCFLKDLLG